MEFLQPIKKVLQPKKIYIESWIFTFLYKALKKQKVKIN